GEGGGQPALQRTLRKPLFAYDLSYWEQLSGALLPAALKEEIEGCDLLCIVPHGSLHSLPFAALRWSEQEYLAQRFGLCHAPSATVLHYCRRKNRRRYAGAAGRPESCFVAAIAAEDDEDPADFEADGEMLAGLFRGEPGGKVTSLVGAAPRDGAEPASKDRIRERMPGHDVVHMACH